MTAARPSAVACENQSRQARSGTARSRVSALRRLWLCAHWQRPAPVSTDRPSADGPRPQERELTRGRAARVVWSSTRDRASHQSCTFLREACHHTYSLLLARSWAALIRGCDGYATLSGKSL